MNLRKLVSKIQSATSQECLPRVVFMLALLVGLAGLFNSTSTDSYDLDHFGRLPVQAAGRVKPLDSLARNQLRLISGRTEAESPEGRVPAIQWLLTLGTQAHVADDWPVFRIDHPDVLGLFGKSHQDGKYFSFNQLKQHFEKLQEQSASIPPDAAARNTYQTKLVELTANLTRYNALAHAFHPLGATDILIEEYRSWRESVPAGREAIRQRQQGQPFDDAAAERFAFLADRYLKLSNTANIGLTPPDSTEPTTLPDGSVVKNDWLNSGETLLKTIQTGEIAPTAIAWAELSLAWNEQDAKAFNAAVHRLEGLTIPNVDNGRLTAEHRFNLAEPYFIADTLYVVALIGYCIFFLVPSKRLRLSTTALTWGAFTIHTLALLARMYIQGRPPVTNLYSSAIFCGWGGVLLGLIVERLYRDGLGGFVAAIVGFTTLIVAHNLPSASFEGDTLESMRAVLDSNFWLATHVVIVTLGYSAMFVAGFMAAFWVVRQLPPKHMQQRWLSTLRRIRLQTETAKDSTQPTRSLYSMVYGITAFALIFSFVGTMLGGIWADQSWGRFWGWDPKENGALLIVLWTALMLHARFGGVVRERGFMALAIFGNIVTSWSWFGTNMLGVGLHSYGFMDAAFVALSAFWISQLLLIALAFFPRERSASPETIPTKS